MLILSESGEQSSIRAALFAVTLGVLVILLSVSGVIVASVFNKDNPDWGGMATLVSAIAVPLSAISGAKVWQKKFEMDQKTEEAKNELEVG